MRNLFYRLLIFFLPFMISCEYEPDDYYMNPVSAVDSADIKISLEPGDSLIQISSISYIKYSIEPGNHKIYELRIYIDDILIKTEVNTEVNTEAYITVDPADYDIDYHNLTFEMIVSNSSGSIGDQLGLEGFFYRESFPVYMDGQPPGASEIPQITKVFVEGNEIHIEWEKYDRINFEGYYLFKIIQLPSGGFNKCQIAEITEQDDTTAIDPTYLGGNIQYQLGVLASGKFQTSEPYTFEDTTMYSLDFSGRYIGGKQVKFSWKPSQFPENFAGYEIYANSINGEVIFSSDNIYDTTFFYDDAIFATETSYFLTLIPNDPCNYQGFYSTSINVKAGFDFPPFKNFETSDNRIFIVTESDIKKIDPVTVQVLDSFAVDVPFGGGTFTVSENGEHMVLLLVYQIIYGNPNDLSTLKKYQLSELGLTSTVTSRISNQGYILAYKNQIPVIFDMVNKEIVAEYPQISNANTIDYTGTKVLNSNYPNGSACYEITGQNAELLWNSSYYAYYLLKNHPDKILFDEFTQFTLRDISNLQTISTFPKDGFQLEDIDIINDHVLIQSYSESKLRIYHYVTGELIKEMDKNNSKTGIYNNKIFDKNGYWMNIL